MVDVSSQSDAGLDNMIANYERQGATGLSKYGDLLEERARRSVARKQLSPEMSLDVLKAAALAQGCTTYGAVAAASNVPMSKAHFAMSGAGGHLERVLDVCHARGLPLLTALCVNQQGLEQCELEPAALKGFCDAARRLGHRFSDDLEFHHNQRKECWAWGLRQAEASSWTA